MNTKLRYTLAILAGVVVEISLVASIESIGHRVYPLPAGLDLTDKEQLSRYIQDLPIGALLYVLSAWLIATFIGGLAACFIAKTRPLIFAGAIGFFVMTASIANLVMIPHPVWFMVTALVTIPMLTFLASYFASRLINK